MDEANGREGVDEKFTTAKGSARAGAVDGNESGKGREGLGEILVNWRVVVTMRTPVGVLVNDNRLFVGGQLEFHVVCIEISHVRGICE